MDLDGTLEDSRQDMVAAANRVRAGYSLPERPFAELQTHVAKGMEHLYRNCLAELFAAVNEADAQTRLLALIQQRYEEEYARGIATQTKPYDGIPAALEEISATANIVIYTNKPERLSRLLLEKLNLLHLIKAVIGADTYAQSKPAVEPMLAIASTLGHQPQERAVFIGDSAADMQAASSFGAGSIWCSWGYLDEPPTPKPDTIAGHPRDLPALARQLLTAGHPKSSATRRGLL